MGASLRPLSGEVLSPVRASSYIFAKLSMPVMRFFSIDQTLAGEGFHQAEVVLEQALGCCGLGPVESLGSCRGLMWRVLLDSRQ